MGVPLTISDINKNERTPLGFLLLTTLVLGFLNYGSISEHYTYAFTVFEFPEMEAGEVNFRENFFRASSVVYLINDYLKLHYREWVVFSVYMASVLAAAALLYWLVRRHFYLSPWATVPLVIMLQFVDRKILPNAWPVMNPIHPGSPSMYATIFGVVVLFFLFEKKPPWAALSLLALHLFATKEHVLLLPSAILFVYFCKDLGWRKALFFLIPFGYLAAMALMNTTVKASPEVMRELMRFNIASEAGDGSFLYHSFSTNAAFLLSLIVTAYLVRPLASHVRVLVWSFCATAAALWLVNVVHVGFFWQEIPISQLIYIGPVRSMRYVIFLFYLVAMVRIFGSGLYHHEKAGLLLGLFGASPHSVTSSTLSIAIIAAVFLPRYLARRGPGFLARPAELLNGQTKPWPQMLAVALFALTWVTVSTYYQVRWDSAAYAHTGRWSGRTVMMDSEWSSYEKLRQDDVYTLMAIYKDERGPYVASLELPAHARKVAFNAIAFAGFVLTPTLAHFQEAENRDGVERAILASLNAGRVIDSELIKFLAERNVRVMLPSVVAGFFPDARVMDFGTLKLLSFPK